MAERTPVGLVDVAAVAAYLGVSHAYVYEHQVELGARRLGTGPKARLRFSLEEIDERLRVCPTGRRSGEPDSGSVVRKPRRRRSPALGTTVELLPIRGRGRA